MKKSLLFFLIVFFALSHRAIADWPCRADQSLAISTDAGNQWNTRLASDGKNGAFIVWQDRRGGSNDKLYLQHVDAVGKSLWQQGGIQLSGSSGLQYYPDIISDGAGGAYVVWQDNRYGVDYDIFVQRISSGGLSLWYPGGTLVCNATGHQYNPQVVTDGKGGIIVVWQDRRNVQFNIYAQRFDGAGIAQWTTNGQVVCAASGDQINPRLAADGTGGAIFAWIDYRTGSGLPDIFSQRLLANGEAAWTADGVGICKAINTQWNARIVSDNANGAFIAWQDRRSGTADQIYIQKVNSSGQTLLTENGIPVASTKGLQYYPSMSSDGNGGVVVVWQDNRSGSDYDIYAQCVDGTGRLVWDASGLSVCNASGHQYYPQVVADGGSIIMTWEDKRNGADYDIYTQRCNPSGTPAWPVNGIPVVTFNENQFSSQAVADGAGGAIVAWSDYRSGTGSTDVYAQRVGANGKLAGGCYRTFVQDSLAVKASRIRSSGSRGRILMPNAGNLRDSVFARGAFEEQLYVGIPREDSSDYYGWIAYTKPVAIRNAVPQRGSPRGFKNILGKDFVGEVKNLRWKRYSNRLAGEQIALKLNIAASDAEITPSGFGDLVFNDRNVPSNPLNHRSLREVSAYIDSVLTLWRWYPGLKYSQVDSSVRNVNKAFTGLVDTVSTSPLEFTATRPLFTSPYLSPNIEPPARVPQMHARSIEPEVPEGFALYQNYPNPFNPTTTIEFGLDEAAVVKLTVYNVLGQEIATLINNQTLESGRQIVDFDGVNLPSGIYFYRVTAKSLDEYEELFSKVRKMVLMK